MVALEIFVTIWSIFAALGSLFFLCASIEDESFAFFLTSVVLSGVATVGLTWSIPLLPH